MFKVCSLACLPDRSFLLLWSRRMIQRIEESRDSTIQTKSIQGKGFAMYKYTEVTGHILDLAWLIDRSTGRGET